MSLSKIVLDFWVGKQRIIREQEGLTMVDVPDTASPVVAGVGFQPAIGVYSVV